ncbi:ATPase family AAA domain-containing protein 5 isoform X2 [Pristis pectinata]|uniref:ATPase family AAA domain-containing protein 5 isoform X2 n=1 Tax=Pristis pectinata TaxID=685728 RepID=UPI00223D9290|nr:ATPase family AAA domain-containing protein 5 isoform X2 [Pristis pectinata]
MVGILAMADTVEEYDQPCKKQRKDVEDSPTNTITSYFSPVSKSVDTTSPSPKSNNILDYFKKTQSGQHVASQTSVEWEGKNLAGVPVNNSKELTAALEGKNQTPKRKRSSKRVNLSKRLLASDCNEVFEISDTSDSSTAEVCDVRSGVGVLGSDTAALIAQLCAKSEELFEDNKDDVSIDLDTTTRRKTAAGARKARCKESINCTSRNLSKKAQKQKFRRKEVDSFVQSDVESVAKDDCCESRGEGSVTSQFVAIEDEGTCLSEKKLEPTTEETSSQNNSTVTVSFEEFMKNQESTEALAEKGAGIHSESSKSGSLVENTSLTVPQPVSPKTVTVHVQVHPSPVSTLPRISKVKQQKIASIFLRKKPDPEDEVAEIQEASPHSADATDPAPPRRSNVVIAEEELELSVLDITEKSPVKAKSGRAEREQFMNAFRQPLTAELAKNGVKKVMQKPRGSKEGVATSEAAEEGSDNPSQEKENEESIQPIMCAMSSQTSKDSRVKVIDSGNTTTTRKKLLKCRKCPQDIGKAECKNVVDLEGEEADPSVETSAESRHSVHIDPATTRSSETCRVTRQSLRQQRAASVYCLTPNKPIAVDCLGTPVHVSTPKRTHWSSEENSIYKAEMLPAASNQSPFRMKFTRLSRSRYAEKAREVDENLDFTPKSNQICKSKNLAEAKRLVEKAKAQNKCRNRAETVMPLRRSTRQQARFNGKSHRTENSAINLNSSTESISSCKILNEKKHKKLKNLSDVLGKNLGTASAAKNTTVDVKVASIFLAKKVVKALPLEPITILDESSCNGSENSQDMKQFRAKRQFLMSGLPDTLKKHIAKTAAAMEIYSAAGISFQTVVHIQQKSQASLLWDLPWPSCAILNRLQDVSGRVEGILKGSLSLGDFSEVNCTATTTASWIGLSNWRTEFSEDIQKCLLEEIRSSNPEFPVRKLFKPLLQKRNDHFADMLRTELDAVPQQVLSVCSSPEPLLGKRKRKVEKQDQKQKRKKALDSEQDLIIIKDEENCTLALPPRSEGSTKNGRGIQNQNCTASTRNRLSKSVKRKQQKSECETKVAETQTTSAPSSVSELTDQPKREEAATSDGLVKEDLLWTEKYQPQHSSELVGNLNAVRKLHSWLMEWKKRADKEETKTQKERKTEKDKKVDAWDNSDFNLESSGDEDFLCNTVLITGPPGVGKTAAVYACAQELGFKVFEVNASSQRSGRQILSQLKEATQSHQVDKQGGSALKPAFFSGSKSLPAQTARSPKKANSPRNVVTSPRKAPLSPKKRGSKKTLAPMFLANFFKVPLKSNKNEESEKADSQMSVKPQTCKAQKNAPQVSEVSKIHTGSESKDLEECNRKSATSLILFEEVDVIFDDDAGFLNAIKTFMATAKRPVILTTTDPNFSLMFECCFEEIRFKVPSSTNVASYLQLLCLAENLRTDRKDLTTLLALNKCDIRQSILYLQFWVRSGGGYKVDKFLPAGGTSVVPVPPEKEPVRNAVGAEDTGEGSSKGSSVVEMQDVPKCNTGCAENLLGFKNNAEPSNCLFSMFKRDVVSLEQWRSQVQVLLEFQRRRLDFIFNNLEFLLPLPLRVIPDPKKPEKVLVKETGPSVCNSRQKAGNSSAKSGPVRISGRMKRGRKTALFDDSDLFDNELNNSNAFVTLPNEISTSSSVADKAPGSLASAVNENNPSESRINSSIAAEKKPRTLAEKKCCELLSSCLGSIAEFTDSISFLDCCLNRGVIESEGSCGQSSYHWAAAEIKNGMLDERRLDSGDWWSFHCFGETRAAVEALSWNKCRSQIQRAMDSFGTKCVESGTEVAEELVLHVPNHQNNNTVFTDLLHYHTRFPASTGFCLSRKHQPRRISAASKRIDVLKTVFSNNKAFVGLGNRRASAMEYLPALRTICRAEKLKEQGKAKRRFLHYLDGAHLELPKNTLEALAADFP